MHMPQRFFLPITSLLMVCGPAFAGNGLDLDDSYYSACKAEIAEFHRFELKAYQEDMDHALGEVKSLSAKQQTLPSNRGAALQKAIDRNNQHAEKVAKIIEDSKTTSNKRWMSGHSDMGFFHIGDLLTASDEASKKYGEDMLALVRLFVKTGESQALPPPNDDECLMGCTYYSLQVSSSVGNGGESAEDKFYDAEMKTQRCFAKRWLTRYDSLYKQSKKPGKKSTKKK